MSGGVQFTHAGQTYKTYFPNPEAVLPVLLRDGHHQLLPWGRREGQEGQLPRGGWARHDSIVNGVWDPYFPKAVKLDLQAFMEKDAQGKSHWYPLLNGRVQGLVARAGEEERVYVVTPPSPGPSTAGAERPRARSSRSSGALRGAIPRTALSIFQPAQHTPREVPQRHRPPRPSPTRRIDDAPPYSLSGVGFRHHPSFRRSPHTVRPTP